MKFLLWRSGLMAALLLHVGVGSAAESPLSLGEAVQLASTVSSQMRAKSSGIEAAEAVERAAGRLPDPELAAGLQNVPVNGVDAGSLGRDSMTMRTVGLMQSLPNRHKREAQRTLADQQLEVARAESAETRVSVERGTADAWIGLSVADEELRALDELLPAYERLVSAAKISLANAQSSVLDAVNAQTALNEVEDRRIEAQRVRSAALAELRQWVGSAADRPLAPTPDFKALAASTESLLASLHDHASLRTYDARIIAAKAEIGVAESERHPDWATELNFGERGPGFSNMVSFQVRVTLPLWTAGRQDPVIRAKRAEADQLAADRDTALRMHGVELQQQLAQWESSRDRIKLLESAQLPLARQATELALAGYQSGRVDLRQVLVAQAAEVELRLRHAELLGLLGTSWSYLSFEAARGATP